MFEMSFFFYDSVQEEIPFDFIFRLCSRPLGGNEFEGNLVIYLRWVNGIMMSYYIYVCDVNENMI